MPVPASEAPVLPVLAGIAGLYIAQSVVSGLTFVALPAVMREAGLPLDRIGLTYLVMLPWLLKVLWAPSVERYRLPRSGRQRTVGIVSAGMLAAAAAVATTALVGPAAFGLLIVLLGIAAAAAATVDIACDGFAVERLAAGQRGWGNAAQVGGAYVGLALGGGFFLLVAAQAGWAAAALTMAGLLVACSLPFLVVAPGTARVEERPHRPSLRTAAADPAIRTGLVLVLVFGLGQRLGQGMLAPFLVDTGLDLASLGVVNGLGGASAGLLGTIVGGAAVRRLGAERSVRAAIRLQAACLAALALAAVVATRHPATLVALTLLAGGSAAFGFVSVYATLMGYASRRQAGVDFTLFQCADALVALVGGTASGLLAARFGYPACFALAAGAALAASLAVPALLRRGARRLELGRTAPIAARTDPIADATLRRPA